MLRFLCIRCTALCHEKLWRRARAYWKGLEKMGIIRIKRERTGWRIFPSQDHLAAHRGVRASAQKRCDSWYTCTAADRMNLAPRWGHEKIGDVPWHTRKGKQRHHQGECSVSRECSVRQRRDSWKWMATSQSNESGTGGGYSLRKSTWQHTEGQVLKCHLASIAVTRQQLPVTLLW